MPGTPKQRFPRQSYRDMWRAVRGYVSGSTDYDHTMDDLSVSLTDAEWDELLRWLNMVDDILAEKPEKPLPAIRERLGVQF